MLDRCSARSGPADLDSGLCVQASAIIDTFAADLPSHKERFADVFEASSRPALCRPDRRLRRPDSARSQSDPAALAALAAATDDGGQSAADRVAEATTVGAGSQRAARERESDFSRGFSTIARR